MRFVLGWLLVCALIAPGAVETSPAGQMTWAVHVTIAPTWFDPAETPDAVANFPYSSPYEDLRLK